MTLPPLRFEYAASPASIADPASSATWTWHDATGVVRLSDGPTWNRGRQDERQAVGPGAASWTVDDPSGDWAPDGSGVVSIGSPIRVRYALVTGNMVTNSTLETNATGWSGYGTPTPTVARSTAQAWQGSASLLVTWGTSASAASQNALYQVTGLVVGRQYTVSAYVRVPAGKPAVKVGIWFLAASAASSVTDAWERLSVTFTATLSSLYVNVANAAATTSGDTCYVDGIMIEEGSAASAFTATAPSWAPLWSGFVSGLQSAWVNGVLPVCRVRGIDLMGWLARQETSVPDAAASGIASLSPVCWWPCDDPAGALNLRQIGSSAMPSLAAVHVGEGGGSLLMQVDGVPALRLDPVGDSGGYQLAANAPVGCSTDRTYAVHFRASRRPDGGTRAYLCGWADYVLGVDLLIDDGGRLAVDTRISGNPVTWSNWPDVADGRWHHVALVLQEIAGTGDYGLTAYLDGEPARRDGGWSTGSPAADAQSNLVTANVSNIYLGQHAGWAGDIAHVVAFGAALTQEQIRTAAGPGCSSGLDAGEAVTALLAPTGVVPTTTGTFAAVLTALDASKSMLAAMQSAAAAERGIVHATAAGTLEVQARSVRRSASAALTLDATEVASDLAPQSDEQSVVNDVTVTGPNNAVARRIDQTSLAAYGRRAQSVSLPLGTVAACDDHAAWMVSTWSAPSVRVGAALVQATVKAATVDTATLLGVDVSDVVTISGLPGTPASLDLFVEGVAMRAGLAGLDVTFNLSPQAEPDLIDYAAEGTLLGWWDARFPAGTSTQVADQTLLKTVLDLSGNDHHASATGSVNLLNSLLATHETAYDAYTWPGSWSDQYNGYPAWSSYSRQSAMKHDGTYGGLATWAVGSKAHLTGIGIFPNDPAKVCEGIIPGGAYTVSMWVLVSGTVHAAVGHYTDTGTEHSGGGGWERLYWHTYADTSDTGLMGHAIAGNLKIGLVPTQDGYGLAYFDSVMVEEGHVTPGTFNTDAPATLRPRLRYGAPGSSPTLETSLVGHVLPLASAVTDALPCTLYAVVRPDALDRWLLAHSSTSGHFGLTSSAGGAKWLLRYKSAGDAVYSSEFASPVGSLCVVTVQIGTGGAVAFRHNGAAVGGGTDAGVLGLDFDRLVGTNAAPWTGGIGAILAYGDAHDAATVARIERALALMWGVEL